MQQIFETFIAEEAKFEAGNKASAMRARKALQELIVAAKARRKEIAEKRAQMIAEAKAAKAAK